MSIRFFISLIFIILNCSFVKGQAIDSEWYSEYSANGLLIQNSYPKGGLYNGPTDYFYNYSYLVFFTRVVNETETPLELNINFSADSIEIPNSPDTYVKLFLPPDTMTHDKRSSFSYGITELESFKNSTRFQRTINPNEECLFNVVSIFYQIRDDVKDQQRGGNRAEFIIEGQDIYYRMPPQIESLLCGHINLSK